MSEGVRQIVTRERTSSSRSKNDLKDIPIAGPLLGETQGQLTSPRNIKGLVSKYRNKVIKNQLTKQFRV